MARYTQGDCAAVVGGVVGGIIGGVNGILGIDDRPRFHRYDRAAAANDLNRCLYAARVTVGGKVV